MKTRKLTTRLEVWGGIECTINQHHDFYKDQLVLSNHYNRSDDLEAFADLGKNGMLFLLSFLGSPKASDNEDIVNAIENAKTI